MKENFTEILFEGDDYYEILSDLKKLTVQMQNNKIYLQEFKTVISLEEEDIDLVSSEEILILASPIETLKKVVDNSPCELEYNEVLTISLVNFICVSMAKPILFGGKEENGKYIIWIRKPEYKEGLKKALKYIEEESKID